MSNGQRRYSFAELTTAANVREFVRDRNSKRLAECSVKEGSRFIVKKVKRHNYLSRALLRSAFGRSED
jgi:hypothetical protein